ncbi:MAG: hypothetical protein A4E24_00907 [Methanomethylovorans sp. PtaU1.Bin093]|nr:MAG: hypothetical protein A4E24_00907 [Methanomethylovorans sp. PtaU1.Bin093]
MNCAAGAIYFSLPMTPSTLCPRSLSSSVCTSSMTTVPILPSRSASPDLRMKSMPSYVPTIMFESRALRIFRVEEVRMRALPIRIEVVIPNDPYLSVNWSYFWFASATRGTRYSIFPFLRNMFSMPASSPIRVFPVAVTEVTSWCFPLKRPASTALACTGSNSSDFRNSMSLKFLDMGRSAILIVLASREAWTVSNLVSSWSRPSGSNVPTVLSRSLVCKSISSMRFFASSL